jgi:4-hydroxy-3-polyprenylbenzoate decarboxylase
MLQVTECGAIVAPPVPAFYHRSSNIAEIIDHFARRMIDLLELTGRLSLGALDRPSSGVFALGSVSPPLG